MSSPFFIFHDFDGDGEFDKTEEDMTPYLDGSQDIVWTRGRNSHRRFDPAQAGEFGTDLRDPDGRFSPWNTESDLAGQLGPGNLIQIQTKPSAGGSFALASGDTLELASGDTLELAGTPGRVVGTFLSDGFPPGARWEDPRVRYRGIGVISRLVDTFITGGVYQLIKISAALHLVLDKIGWPEDKRLIDESLTSLLWFHPEGAAIELVARLVRTEGFGAEWGEDADGNFFFYNREYRQTNPRATMSQMLFTDLDFRVVDLAPDKNLRDVIKACRATIEEKAPAALAEIWNHGDPLVLGPNEEDTIEISGGGLFINAQTPTDVASNTIWKFEGDQALTEGTFKGKYLGQITAALNFNDSASDFQTAFEALSTIMPGNISFSGGPLNVAPVFGELIGAFEGVPITDVPEIVDSTLNPVSIPGAVNVREVRKGGLQYEIQALDPTGILTAGVIAIDIVTSGGSGSTNDLPYDATADDIAQEFRDIAGLALSNTEGAGGPLDQGPVILDFADWFEDLPDLVVNQTGVMMQAPGATVNVEVSQTGGIPDLVVIDGDLAEIELLETSGSTVPLRVKAGPDGLTLSVRVRAQSLEVVRTQKVTYPPNTMLPQNKIDTPDIYPDITRADALLNCQGRVEFYQDPPGTGVITYEAEIDSPEVVDRLFRLRQADKIRVTNARAHLDHDAHIGNFKYEYDQRNFVVRARIGYELAE